MTVERSQSHMPSPTIWYVHPYAGGPSIGRYDRPYHLGRAWQAMGARVIVITASFHHLLDTPGSRRGAAEVSGVPYAFLATPRYAGNGLGRLMNMGIFAAQIWRHADSLAGCYGRPDMIIGSSPHPYVFPATHRLARSFGAYSVFEVRDLWPLSLVELAGVKPTHPLVRFTARLERFAYAKADAVVSLLPNTLSYMEERGLDPERWHYVPNGVPMEEADDGRDQLSPPAVQARQWQEQGKRVVVYAGALGVPNHVASLVHAMKILRDRGEKRLASLIVGRGEEAPRLQDMVRSHNLQDLVAIYPQIPKQAVYTLLKSADAGYISLRPEPLFRFGISPNKLFDYMLARLPVIFAIEAGNNPVRDHHCGFSVAPGNAEEIAAALAEFASLPREEQQAMGERGFQYVLQNHEYGRLATQYLRILGRDRQNRQ